MRKLLAVFAHPDDEAFGPGGTLTKYGHEGVEIHILCVTRGEAGGDNNLKSHPATAGSKLPPSLKLRRTSKTTSQKSKFQRESVKYTSGVARKDSPEVEESEIGFIREMELLKSAEILGIKRVEFLDFVDGQLCNNNYHQLAEKIIKKIKEFKPQVLLVNERLGISGHLDHIAVSLTTTFAYQNTKEVKKLYYYCLPKKYREKILDKYFIYFPEGYDEDEITTRIDFSKYWKIKVKAMYQHKSQMRDVERLMVRFITQPKIDNFILHQYRGLKPHFPETDLFTGLD